MRKLWRFVVNKLKLFWYGSETDVDKLGKSPWEDQDDFFLINNL